MKNVMISLAALFSFSTFASLENSKLELRHQDLIEKSIIEKCGLTRGMIYEVNTKVTELKIDQGITDYQFETLFEVHIRLDQNIFDEYEITIKSAYSDSYDHSSREWGIYSIESVSSCVMK